MLSSIRKTSTSILLLSGVLFASLNLAAAEVACPAEPHWSGTEPSMNIDHVFCGEVKRNRAKGFHSRPGGENPATVESFVLGEAADARGIYSGTVTLSNPEGDNPSKFSTMFPDNCSQHEVMKSILHAYEHPQACPEGAPGWATCGLNRPEQGGTGYCVGKDAGLRFTIAFATLKNGKINTAFPLR